MAKIIEFPYDRIDNPIDPVPDQVYEDTSELIKQTVASLRRMGYDIKDQQLVEDIGVISNLLVAALMRSKNREHFLDELLEELYDEFQAMRDYLDDFD